MEIEIRMAGKKDIRELRSLYQQLVEYEYSLNLPYKESGWIRSFPSR